MATNNSINVSTAGIVGFSGTAFVETSATNHAVLVGGSTTSTFSNVGPTATSGQILQSAGSSADPAFSTATYPATTTINQVLYSSSANVVGGITASANGVLISSATNVPSWLAAGSTGQVLTATTGSPATWASPASASISLTGDSGGALSSSAFTITGGTTGHTFAGSGTTLTLGGVLILANGGTSANLTANNGGIFYSTASAGAILSGTATANKVLMSGATAAPTWSTPTFPNASATTRKIIVSDGTNWVASTETYAVPGTSGNVLTSDGTNWTSSSAAAGGSYSLQCGAGGILITVVDSTTYYVIPFFLNTSFVTSITNTSKINIPKTGTITKFEGTFYVEGTLGTSENVTIAVRLNNTTNNNVTTTLQTTAAANAISNSALSIAVTAGDFINVMIITPAWATNPTSCRLSATIFIS